MGKIYAMVVVVEADDGEEAMARVGEEVSTAPANAHFVGEPVEVEWAERYTSRSIARQIAGGPIEVFSAEVAHRHEGLHLFADEGDRNAFATAAESEGETVRRGELTVNDEEAAKRLISAEVAAPVVGRSTSPGRSPLPDACGGRRSATSPEKPVAPASADRKDPMEMVREMPSGPGPGASASSPPLALIAGVGEAGGSLPTAAALACAGTDTDRATLLVDLGGGRPRPTLLATPAARALEACVGSALPLAAVAARGGFCQLALPDDDAGLAALATVLAVADGTPAVVHVPGGRLAALLDARIAPRAAAVLLCRADGEDPPSVSPLCLELLERGLTVAVLERRLGWASERRALFGGLRPDEQHGLPQALRQWFAGGAAGQAGALAGAGAA